MLLAAKKQIYNPNPVSAAKQQNQLHEMCAEFDALWTLLTLCSEVPDYIRAKPVKMPSAAETMLDRIKLDVDSFSLRARAVFEENQITTVGDLARHSVLQLLATRNSGETVLAEIAERLLACFNGTSAAVVPVAYDTDNVLIAECEFSIRSRNCLQKMGIHTLGDLARTSEEKILASKNFGETSLIEIKEMLASHGLALGSLPPKPAHISELELSVRSQKAMNKFGLKTVDELTRMSADDLLECRNFGPSGLNEIRVKLAARGLALKGENASDLVGQLVKTSQRKKIVR
jgi:DNA-directed RNA polymerase alpha subunit